MRSLVSSHFDYNLTSRGHFFSLHIQNGIVQVLPCGPVVIYDRRKICQKSVLHNNIQSKEKKVVLISRKDFLLSLTILVHILKEQLWRLIVSKDLQLINQFPFNKCCNLSDNVGIKNDWKNICALFHRSKVIT